MRDLYGSLAAASEQDEPFALGIISGIKGSSPQKKGAKALFFADGRIQGTLGGGCLEAEVQQRARQALFTNEPESFELVLDHDFGWDDGLICGGKVSGLILPLAKDARGLWQELAQRQREITWGVSPDFHIREIPTALGQGNAQTLANSAPDWLYQETVGLACALWIAGAGHVGQAVAPLAQRLDFAVTVFDDRPALAAPQFFPAGTRFRVDYWEKMLTDPLPPQPTFGLIVTRGHQHDALVLRHWIHQPFSFLGMIGSRRKKRLIFEQFMTDKIATASELERVATPVGIDILAHSVDEIAVSIMAQYVQKRGELVFGRKPKGTEDSLPRGRELMSLCPER